MAKWTPEQLKDKLALWLNAENVKIDTVDVYGKEVNFVKEVLDLSGNQSNAYNLDSTNVTRPIIKENSLNGLPTLSFSDFTLSKTGEKSSDYSSNNYVVPDHLIIDHKKEMDFSETGASIFVVFKPNLKREIGFRFLKNYYKDIYTSSELTKLLTSGFETLKFPEDSYLASKITEFENDGVKRATDSSINDLSTLLPTVYNAPGFQIRLQIDDLYANESADNFEKLNAEREVYGLPALPTTSSEDSFGDQVLDYLTERKESGVYKVKAISTFGSGEKYLNRQSKAASEYAINYTSTLSASSELKTTLDSLGVKTGPNFNESYDKFIQVYGNTELHRTSDDYFYEPVSEQFSIMSIVTNAKTGSIDDTGGYNTWSSPSNQCGFFKNGEPFGGEDNLISIPGTGKYSGWVHSIGAPISNETGRIKNGHDTLNWNVSGSELESPTTDEAKIVKNIIDQASRYGSSSSDLSSDFFSGEIAEIIIFKEELSQANRELVEGYLAWKFGLSLVAGHSYENSAPSYDETQVEWTPKEEESLAMWVSADNVSKGFSSLSRKINVNYGDRDYYIANEDTSAYFDALDDDAEYVKSFIDKSGYRNDLISLESSSLGSKTWPLKAALQLSSEVNGEPSVSFDKVASSELEYSASVNLPKYLSSGEYSNLEYTSTSSSIRTGGIYLRATPIDSSYSYSNFGSQSWVESSRLLIKDKASADFVLKYKSDYFDKSKFELFITVESGLGVNYFNSGDMILLTETDDSHFSGLYDNNGLYQVSSYNNTTGEIKVDLYPKASFFKRVPLSRDPKIGFAPNPVASGTVTKVNLQFANKTAIPYYASTSEEFGKFKTNGGSIFLVMKPNDGSRKQYVLSNGAYNNGESPIWISVGETTNSIEINGISAGNIVDTSAYAIYEFVFPGRDEDISGVSSADALLRYGAWKNAVKQTDQYPKASSWGLKTGGDDANIYVSPPVSSASSFDGNIAEILIFADDLSEDSRERVEWYLSTKYNISLPASHTYSSLSPKTTTSLKWSPKLSPDNLFAWYAPESIADDGYGTLVWRDQHREFRLTGNDDRHLNTPRVFSSYQPTPISTPDGYASVYTSDVLSGNINGLDAIRIQPGQSMAFYGFNNTVKTSGMSIFAVLKYNESSYSSSSDYKNSEGGSILELANQFHNASNSSPKTRYHLSISDTIDGYATNGYNNNLETVYLEANESLGKIQRSSSLSSDSSLTSDTYQIISLVSRDVNGTNTRLNGFYSDGEPVGLSTGSSFELDTIVVSGGGHDITVAEIILYDKELSDFERQRVEGYLACKYNLQSNLSSSHPYKSFCPEVDLKQRALSVQPESITDLWTPYGKDGLIGYYTPDNISYSYDHSGNKFSAYIAPYVLGDAKNFNAVASIVFEKDVGGSYHVHSSAQSAFYEKMIESGNVSESKTDEIINSFVSAIQALIG